MRLKCAVCDYMLTVNSKACHLLWEADSTRAEFIFEQHVTKIAVFRGVAIKISTRGSAAI